MQFPVTIHPLLALFWRQLQTQSQSAGFVQIMTAVVMLSTIPQKRLQTNRTIIQIIGARVFSFLADI
ncbi:hypothetical protein PC118_g23167 [Phytophthora cactorum]|nr:hypothetical protein PC113_g21731 [Phytophthora cactorum]KAG2878531.1 hypothetical protein PC115_g23037 [Phytophthora cactorum]KAG2959148.1 hypothetical protein PC118_g23167 [Phytophthora cactorum]KAG3044039.1 hypothetical protein PC121_g22167 [Phytophthora cactorum]KAG3141961.1 hypothetical protein PC128_g24893 [Phytophthora cactorum]